MVTTDASLAPDATEFMGAPVTYPLGQQVIHATRQQYLPIIEALKDAGFNMAVDVTSVDYLANPTRQLPDGVAPERFEVVANLLSHSLKRRVRIRTQVPAGDPTIPTLFDLYPGTEALEREIYDLMGIVFSNHPDMTRILMPEGWEGHPLRKDYSAGRVPVEFKFPQGKYEAEDRG